MRTVLGRMITAALLLAAWPPLLWAQLASVTRSVPLHRDASTKSPAVEHLQKGERLMLVETVPKNGLYHVRTEDEQVGWVWAKFVTVTQSPHTPGQPTIPQGPVPADGGCDASLWRHVYHPHRLIVVHSCIAVTGVIVDATAGKESDGVRHERDGDTHGWLKPDAPFENLLNAGNRSAEGGNLVFEIVCRFPVKQADAKTACKGFQSPIAIPPVGSHVRLVGTYVQDTFHAQWMEIHPVSSIAVTP